MKKFHLLMILAGCLLIALLIYRIGPGQLWSQLNLLGWALVPLILIEGVADLFHTQAWRHCLSDTHRALPFSRIFCIRMAGYSVNYLTPTIGMGEVAKGVLLASNNTGLESATGIIIDNLSYGLAQLLFVVGGTLVTLPGARMPRGIWVAMLTATALLGVGMFTFLIMQKYGKLGAFLRWLVDHRVGGRRLRKLAASITEVDQELELFYERRRADLLLSVFWHIAGMACGILQCYYFLMVLTVHPSLTIAAGLWFLGTWFNLLSFALPVDLGVMEATRVISFVVFGLQASLGLTYGIALRLEQLFWAGVGLLIYAVLAVQMRKKAIANPEQKTYGVT
ncbi:MAG TPA: flippase-like domain-containing protein [Syntrophorhabdales bacterium]|nr:flippase-like domain-containing protein [Syntrophorhabdales bacterium]